MRKPNYNFERAQRDSAKRAKAEAKAQKKAAEKEQTQLETGAAPDADEAPDAETAEK